MTKQDFTIITKLKNLLLYNIFFQNNTALNNKLYIFTIFFVHSIHKDIVEKSF